MELDDMFIKLIYVNPPIPDRRHDWCAYPDGEEENPSQYGWGRQPWDALRDLATKMEEM